MEHNNGTESREETRVKRNLFKTDEYNNIFL